MYSGQVVSYKYIIDKAIRDFGLNYEINDEEGIEWLAEFMAHTNSPIVMENKIDYVAVCDARGELPFDLHKIRQVGMVDGAKLVEEARNGIGVLQPMRWATDNFHKRYHVDGRDYTTESRHTYTVGQGFVFTSFNTGILAISYDAIPTDECGYPTIPAEQQWIEAAAHYLALRIAKKLFLRNEITGDKYQLIERDKEWYFAQAVNHSKQWGNVDEAETVKNSWIRTIPSIQDHASFFANMQLPEQRKFRPKSGSALVSPINVLSDNAQGPNPAQ